MTPRRTFQQPDLPFPCGWGGRRHGAGRKRSAIRKVPHLPRLRFHPRIPEHITIKFALGPESLRVRPVLAALRDALRALHATRRDFRVAAFSLQDDHLHLIAEADSPEAFASGVQSLTTRVARRFNRALGRKGRVFAERHHRRPLRTPSEVHNALGYVLQNRRRHLAQRGRVQRNPSMDLFSSAGWFDGWTDRFWREREPVAVEPARSWLLRTGWRIHGLLSPSEIPGRG